MELKDILNWAFERHLNPLSWYIRPVFLIILAYFAYRRSWKGLVVTFLLMMSSMFWFPAPPKINSQMHEVLKYEKMLLSNPISATITITIMFIFIVMIVRAFWKHSLRMGLFILNAALIGKLVLALIFTGENGWGPLGNTIFGLILVNGIGFYLLYKMRNKKL
ncbi:hypothetical protein [Priestia megaterium]|uniref:hypothetical protein n=1 Tax=Priestia megaterium TaxID=1404 RepID=UPI002363EC46|nr:hypothetical protein [Priestia megaterium]MDD1515307.1 hypothetical protein [Priestia megaterium]